MNAEKKLHPVKAYKNIGFLMSPEARTIRMLSEFLEPQRRFRKEGVRDTIVFFGSARVLPKKEAEKSLREVRRRLAGRRRISGGDARELEAARMALEMSRYYDDCVVLARLITEWSLSLDKHNRFVVCSGGGPGIMEAANKGAKLAKGKSVGLNISLPFEQTPNQYISRTLNFDFHYFFMRKFWFVYLAKALVVFPGGFGTLDELMEVLTLLQTKKIRKKMIVVIYGSAYWKKILNFDQLVAHGVIARRDLQLFRFIDDPHEAFAYLRDSLSKHYL